MTRLAAGLAILMLALAGCGDDDTSAAKTQPAQQTQSTTAADISLAPFVSKLRLSLAAVEEFMNAFADCLDTQGCAVEERAEALSKIDATTYAASDVADAAADPCGSAFGEVVEGLKRQRRALEGLQSSAGVAEKVERANERMDRATDLLSETVDLIKEDC